jgi:hypothetical protein
MASNIHFTVGQLLVRYLEIRKYFAEYGDLIIKRDDVSFVDNFYTYVPHLSIGQGCKEVDIC